MKLDIGYLPFAEQWFKNQTQGAVRVINIHKPDSQQLFSYNSLVKIERALAIG